MYTVYDSRFDAMDGGFGVGAPRGGGVRGLGARGLGAASAEARVASILSPALGPASQQQLDAEARERKERAVAGARAALCFASVQPQPGANETARRNYATFTGCAEENWPDDPLCNDLMNAALSTFAGTTGASIHDLRQQMQQFSCSAGAPMPFNAPARRRQPAAGARPAVGGTALDLARQTLCAAPPVKRSGVEASVSACQKNGWRKSGDISPLEFKDKLKAEVCWGFVSAGARAAGVDSEALWSALKTQGCPTAAPGVVNVPPPAPPPPPGTAPYQGPPPVEPDWGPPEPPPQSPFDQPVVQAGGIGLAAAVIAAAGIIWYMKRAKKAKAKKAQGTT